MNLLTLASGSANTGSMGSPWLIIIVIAVFVLMFVLTSIPQKKRQKQMQKMLSELKPGDQIKTIGGMIGTVTAVNDMTGILTINVGTEDAPTFITVDRVAIYSVAPLQAATPVVETAPVEEPAKTEEASETDSNTDAENK